MYTEMTAEDDVVLKACPEGWFEVNDTLPQLAINKLMNAGKLEFRLVGFSDNMKTLYQKRDWRNKCGTGTQVNQLFSQR